MKAVVLQVTQNILDGSNYGGQESPTNGRGRRNKLDLDQEFDFDLDCTAE